jgi:hypothetical protein
VSASLRQSPVWLELYKPRGRELWAKVGDGIRR